jgi:hypothetical protein
MKHPDARINARKTGCDGTRTAHVPTPPKRGSTKVIGPGQKRCAKEFA